MFPKDKATMEPTHREHTATNPSKTGRLFSRWRTSCKFLTTKHRKLKSATTFRHLRHKRNPLRLSGSWQNIKANQN